jgi:rare lipoprotein A
MPVESATGVTPATTGATTPHAVVATPQPPAVVRSDYRFDMRQDGKAMSANEFDAWMKSRQVRVATGKPGVPAKIDAPDVSTAPPPPAPPQAAATIAATLASAPRDAGVTLQVASFSARGNADRALAMLLGAGIAGARLNDANANGQKVWRLRVGPLEADAAPELAARIVGLGFGQPQRVRD